MYPSIVEVATHRNPLNVLCRGHHYDAHGDATGFYKYYGKRPFSVWHHAPWAYYMIVADFNGTSYYYKKPYLNDRRVYPKARALETQHFNPDLWVKTPFYWFVD
jgi:hypothetical protein